MSLLRFFIDVTLSSDLLKFFIHNFVPFFSIFIMAPLKSLPIKSNIWSLSPEVSVACFFSLVYGSCFPVSLYVSYFFVVNWIF